MTKAIQLIGYLILCCSINLFAQNNQNLDITEQIELLKSEFGSKLNESLISINIDQKKDTMLLEGYVSDSIIYKKLRDYTKTNNIDTDFDNLVVTPINPTHAIVNVSVADMRTAPGFTKSMATQELLGTVVSVLYKQNGWSLIQCPNKYYGWISDRQIIDINEDDLKRWEQEKKIIYTAPYGTCYSKPTANNDEIVSDLVANNILLVLNTEKEFYKVKYPDNRVGYVAIGDAIIIEPDMHAKTDLTKIMNSVLSMKGLPYIWGGLSTKGMDCSGLVSAAFRNNGYYTYRDASQQALVGKEVAITDDYGNLEYGDLMFFGENSDKIRHVGFYLGDKKFIHASGFVRISSLDKNDKDFDELNTQEFVVARRYIDNNRILNSAAAKINY